MGKFTIRIAETVVAVTSLFRSSENYCQDYCCDEQEHISITITPGDIAFERDKSIREAELEGIAYMARSDAALEIIAIQRKITEALFACNTLLFHGSVVAVDNQAYLFTAKSGTGKSTHTRLWREVLGDRAVMVNDDKPFLRMDENGVTAFCSPWMGKHHLGANISVPLKAICILERGEENRILRITAQEALPMLFQQSQRPGKSKNQLKYLELIDKLAGDVSFYHMACNMDPQAAEISYCAMSGERKEEHNEN